MKESVRAILSSILFQRVLGAIVPQTRQAIGVTYPCIINEQIDSLIEEKVSRLLQILDTDVNQERQIGVQFYEKRSKKSSWFGTRTQQDFCWEQWVLTVKIDRSQIPDNDSEDGASIRRHIAANKLRDILVDVAGTASSNKDHIPAITTTSQVPFPYKIVIEAEPQSSDDRWGSSFMKLLGDTNYNYGDS